MSPALWPLVRVALESTLVLTLVLLVTPRLARAAHAHALLVAGLLAALGAPLVGLACGLLDWGLFPAAWNDVVRLLPPPPLAGSGATAGASWLSLGELAVALAATAALGAGVLLVRLGQGARAARRRIEHARPAERGDLTRIARRVARDFGLERAPRLRISEGGEGPALWGLARRPVVLFPERLVQRSSAAELEAMLRHELAHVRRRDPLWSLLAELAVALLWWNPLAWMVRRRLFERAEEACDAWVLSGDVAPETYARLLVDLIPMQRTGFVLPARPARERWTRRLAAILAGDPSRPREPRVGRLALVLVALLFVTSSASLGLARRRVGDAGPRVARLELASPGVGGVRVLPDELDLGVVPAGGQGRGVTWIANLTQHPVRVVDVKPGCGCTNVRGFRATTLAPGEALALELTMDAPDEPGARNAKTVAVRLEGADDLSFPVHVRSAPAG